MLAPRFPTPEFIERGGVQDLTCPLFDGAAVVVPSDARVTLHAPGRVVALDRAATIIDGVLSLRRVAYDHHQVFLATQQLKLNEREKKHEWSWGPRQDA